MTRRTPRLLLPVLLITVVTLLATPPPAAQAFNAAKPICTLAGLVSGLAGKVCSAARRAGSILKAGQKLLGGHLGSAVSTLTGGGSTAAKAVTATAAIAALTGWVLVGAKAALRETASVISNTTRPQLQSTWFSSSYWRMAGISALLTLPFLFAAAIQALLRSDLSLLVRSAFGYLPLGVLGVSIAAPLTQLLLAASDELSGLVSSASGFTTAGFIHVTTLGAGLGAVSSFPVFFTGLLTVAATMTLWIELLIRSAAVYVIVLMLPLFFAALVWPARRVWAVRAVELLVALILSKFAIVAVLALGAAALGHTLAPSLTEMLAGTTLVMLAAFTPWALLRLLPLHELAAGIEGMSGAGSRGLNPAGAGAESIYARTQPLEDDLAAARGQRSGGTAEPSAARSAVAGLNVHPPAPDDDDQPSPAASAGRASPEPDGSEREPESVTTQARTAPVQTAPEGSRDGHSERLPGMDAQWQARNLAWPQVELGPDSLPEAQLGPDSMPEAQLGPDSMPEAQLGPDGGEGSTSR